MTEYFLVAYRPSEVDVSLGHLVAYHQSQFVKSFFQNETDLINELVRIMCEAYIYDAKVSEDSWKPVPHWTYYINCSEWPADKQEEESRLLLEKARVRANMKYARLKQQAQEAAEREAAITKQRKNSAQLELLIKEQPELARAILARL